MTCWAFKNIETFKDHSIGVLNFFREHFSYTIPILAFRTGIEEEKVRKSVEIAVALHDIGKTSVNYISSQNYYGHEFYSGYLVYKIVEECCDSELTPLVALAAINHHQAMEGRNLKDMFIHGNYTQIPESYEMAIECEKDVKEILEYIGVRIENLKKKASRNEVKNWFMYTLGKRLNETHFNKNLYILILGPLMVSDTVVANKNRGGEKKNRIIEEYEK